MKRAGQVVVFRFPQAEMVSGKLRPALLLGKVPGPYDDWLVCMISSQLRHHLEDFDEMIETTDADFPDSGLKVSSVVRVGRLAVVEGSLLLGSIGEISRERLIRIRGNLVRWLQDNE